MKQHPAKPVHIRILVSAVYCLQKVIGGIGKWNTCILHQFGIQFIVERHTTSDIENSNFH